MSFTYNQLKNKSFEEIQKLYEREQKLINDFVPMDSEVVKASGQKDHSSKKQAESSKKTPRAEHDEESVKKQKIEDDTEKEELRACLDIVPGDDVTPPKMCRSGNMYRGRYFIIRQHKI
uniref:Uncharacterized protein n=1 Tax=Tanacetum cinerariifolium TaxID=118510 RepID=A0A6L2P955_TANCI|nr:hypothetical protein [Tanacetum cinerariifolium]